MKFYDWNNTKKPPPPKAGIYILALNKEIPKAYKTDHKGILYIGKSKILKRRLGIGKHPDWEEDYKKEKDSFMFNHSTLTFAIDIDKDLSLRPHKDSIDSGVLKETDELFLKYATTVNCTKLEKQLLLGHIILYGQLPPFNIKGPTLKYIWNELSDKKWETAVNKYEKIISEI